MHYNTLERELHFKEIILDSCLRANNYDKDTILAISCRRKEMQPLSIEELFSSFQPDVNWLP